MNIILDACAGSNGFLHLLCDDGAILVQARVDNVTYQNVPPSLRPEFTWRPVALLEDEPAGVTEAQKKGTLK